MPEGDQNLSVDLSDLEKGGVDIKHIADEVKNIRRDLGNVLALYPDPGGDGDIGKSVRTVYAPGAEAALQFLDGLTNLVDTHGDETIDLSKIFNDVNDKTISDAGKPVGSGEPGGTTHGRAH